MRHTKTNIWDNARVRWFLFLLVGAVALIYFFQITTVMGRGSDLKKLTKEQATLQEETKRLELTIAEQNSLQNLQQRLPELKLTTGGSVEYARPDDAGAVAVR